MTSTTSTNALSSRDPASRAMLVGAVLLVVGLVGLVLRLQGAAMVDPDLFHEMALGREIVREGGVPRGDVFAYTPTVLPVVHHEWGFGLMMYGVTRAVGMGGLVVVRVVLVGAMAGMAAVMARRRGVSLAMFGVGLLLVGLPLTIGFSTVRAQMVTLAMAAGLAYVMERDRECAEKGKGERGKGKGFNGWLWGWLPVYVVWLNCHAGFVVGVGMVGCYAVETAVKGRRVPWRLAGVLGAMAGLVLVNPYGLDYVWFLGRSLTMSRADITEWAPLWTVWEGMVLVGVMLAAAVYGIVRGKRADGVCVLAVASVLGIWHLRHASLLALLWLIYVPGWLAGSPLEELLGRLWRRWGVWGGAGMAILGVGAAAWAGSDLVAVRLPRVAAGTDEGARVVYPVGAVEELRREGFAGKVLAPFTAGGYVSWELGPGRGGVKVAFDGRYEVAYGAEVARAVFDFYAGRENWREVLVKYPPDVVMVVKGSKVAGLMREEKGWREIYGDEGVILYGRE